MTEPPEWPEWSDDVKRALQKSIAQVSNDRHLETRIQALRDPGKAEREAFRSEAMEKGLLSVR